MQDADGLSFFITVKNVEISININVDFSIINKVKGCAKQISGKRN